MSAHHSHVDQLTPDMQTLCIDGVEVLVEGSGEQTLVFVHGWPDSPALWNGSVAALAPHFRCVRFALPGFAYGESEPVHWAPTAGAVSLDRMCQIWAHILDAISPQQPVTLVMHDWGCIFGYEFAARHPQRVGKLVAVDIGDYNRRAYQTSLTGQQRWAIFSYQFWLASAWTAGRWLGPLGGQRLANRMTRAMASRLRCPTPADQIHWRMNYPYAMQWLGIAGGFRHSAKVAPVQPVLYVYGERKPFMFHSTEWLQWLATKPGSASVAMPCGHWVMSSQPEAFHACLLQWLQNP